MASGLSNVESGQLRVNKVDTYNSLSLAVHEY